MLTTGSSSRARKNRRGSGGSTGFDEFSCTPTRSSPDTHPRQTEPLCTYCFAGSGQRNSCQPSRWQFSTSTQNSHPQSFWAQPGKHLTSSKHGHFYSHVCSLTGPHRPANTSGKRKASNLVQLRDTVLPNQSPVCGSLLQFGTAPNVGTAAFPNTCEIYQTISRAARRTPHRVAAFVDVSLYGFGGAFGA